MSDDRLAFAIDLARRAGDLAARYFAATDSLLIESKGHQDLVSNADREVETFVRGENAAAFPGDGIVGEEQSESAGSTGYVWIIDPIDGTGNFVRGIPAWCVAIAVAHDGVAVAGVICDPIVGETFHAGRGGGAFLNGRPIKTAATSAITEG
jgi:myo-inositol-1(or 4)-monophosphatase